MTFSARVLHHLGYLNKPLESCQRVWKKPCHPIAWAPLCLWKALTALLVLFSLKGSQVTLATMGCLPKRPWDREKAQPKKEGKKVKWKRRYDASQTEFYLILLMFVCLENGPDGCQWTEMDTQGGEDACVWKCGCVHLTVRMVSNGLSLYADICASLTLIHNYSLMALLLNFS